MILLFNVQRVLYLLFTVHACFQRRDRCRGTIQASMAA